MKPWYYSWKLELGILVDIREESIEVIEEEHEQEVEEEEDAIEDENVVKSLNQFWSCLWINEEIEIKHQTGSRYKYFIWGFSRCQL
jgi:hypothetical protein